MGDTVGAGSQTSLSRESSARHVATVRWRVADGERHWCHAIGHELQLLLPLSYRPEQDECNRPAAVVPPALVDKVPSDGTRWLATASWLAHGGGNVCVLGHAVSLLLAAKVVREGGWREAGERAAAAHANALCRSGGLHDVYRRFRLLLPPSATVRLPHTTT